MDAGIGVNENAFGGEPLGTVAGNSIAVIEMAVLAGVEFDLAVVAEVHGHPAQLIQLLRGRDWLHQAICRAL